MLREVGFISERQLQEKSCLQGENLFAFKHDNSVIYSALVL